MKIRIALVLLMAMIFACPALAESPINRQISGFNANTLDFLPEAARNRPDTLIFGVPDLLGETNPFWARTTGDNTLAALLYDELLFANNIGEVGAGVGVPEIAGQTVTITLRDVRYRDGSAAQSEDFINALYLALMPGYDGVYDLTRAGISGVSAYLSGEAAEISGIRRVSETVFTVTFDSAAAVGLVYLTLPALPVSHFGDMRRPDALMNPDAFGDFYEETLNRVRHTDASQMAYGQYTLLENTPGEGARLEKNAAYWRGEPKISFVELEVVSPGAELDAILSGEVDIISMIGSVSAVDAAYNYESGFVNLYTWKGDVVGYLGMDLTNPMFSDKTVRRALAMGFDRDAARYQSVERYGNVPGMLLFDSFSETCDMLGELYPYNPEEAARLLDEAGWLLEEDGFRHKGELTFIIPFYYNTPNPVMDRVIVQMVMDFEALGIGLQITELPFDALLKAVDAGDCPMYFQARRLPQSPAIAADLFAGESHLNQSGYDTEALDRMLRRAAQESDAARQTVLYEGLYQELYLDLPIIPLYRRDELLMVSARVMNASVTSSHELTSDVYRFLLTDSLANKW